MRVRTLFVVLGLVLLPVAQANATPFTNGSFESASVSPGGFTTLGIGSTAITGWEVFGATIDYIGSHWQHADGNRSLDLNGSSAPGGVKQTFDTVINQSYVVEFAMAGNPDFGPALKELTVTAGAFSQNYSFNTVLGAATRSNMGWVYNTFQFTASSTSTTLMFQSATTSTCCWGAALDDVTVTAPEPLTFALLGTGGLVVAVRRRYFGN